MGDQPCPIIPIPKQMSVTPGPSAWPSKVVARCETEQAIGFVEKYEGCVRGKADGELSILLSRAELPPGGYEAILAEKSIVVSASDRTGFRHALHTLRQLASEPRMPVGCIRDWPALPVRGFHLNLASYRRLDVDLACRLVESAASLKLNTLLVEYGARFPFRAHAAIQDPIAFSESDVARLTATAADHGIEIIPLQQSLAHLEYALSHSSLAHLRERQEKANLLCPAHPQSMVLVKTLVSEILAAHPQTRRFHLGGDEARKFGQCSRCAAAVRESGVGGVYGRYMGELARWLLDKGVRPILWDDTICAHPDALEHIPKETIIAYWDYIAVADPTPVLIPRMAHALGGPRVVHDWRWSTRRKAGTLSEAQIEVMQNYSQPVRMSSSLGKAYLAEFGAYLGEGYPRWFRALPYLEYYQARGHEVICCPSGMGNGDTKDGLPNFRRFDANISTHARRCIANGKALGLVTTMWYNMAAELMYQPLARTAQHAW
jgi:hypothetical protein